MSKSGHTAFIRCAKERKCLEIQSVSEEQEGSEEDCQLPAAGNVKLQMWKLIFA